MSYDLELQDWEIEMIAQELESRMSGNPYSLEAILSRDSVQNSCPPGVIPEDWAEYLDSLPTMEWPEVEEGEEEMSEEEMQDYLKSERPGISWDWEDRMNRREMIIQSQINLLDLNLPENPEEDDWQQEQDRRQMQILMEHMETRNGLDEPEDLDLNRKMWLLEYAMWDQGFDWSNETLLAELESRALTLQQSA
ncbi:hypothetical protein HFU84_08600 [Acidithiobacillus sp. CV18-2]|nr:hypothetical protein [Acidithiobacillus sp. CV18-3]MBU2756951.1 hypothetical protein [Acidithiobacillus sp. BN09-2]MBU2777562.1 hypothetical protein [Acidithiobacillus sp. CV18-2]MBU2799662.1 hypothetical protein [Acidithiobacillus sp. VAN18-4]